MKKIHCYLIFCCCLLISCNPMQAFESPGKQTTLDFSVASFNELIIENIFEVEIIPDTVNRVEFKGGENQLESVTIAEHNGSITISHDYKNITRNFDKIKANIHYTNLNKLTPATPCKLTGKFNQPNSKLNIIIPVEGEMVDLDLDITANELYFHSYGSITASVKLTGECPTASYVLNGIINLQNQKLKSKSVKVLQNSISDVHIWAEEKLNVNIYSSGNIYYKGNPEITVNRVQINNQTPTGKVINEVE